MKIVFDQKRNLQLIIIVILLLLGTIGVGVNCKIGILLAYSGILYGAVIIVTGRHGPVV